MNFPKSLLHIAGFRYWSAPLLPALVGTTLPFWLRPSGFAFNWSGAVEFLFATLLLHAGFACLLVRFKGEVVIHWTETRLATTGAICLIAACLLGLHLNRLFSGIIFLVYGLTTIFTGILYVAPPFRFYWRAGGEIVLSEGLGLLPVLGAYLVQTGDLTRSVYLAALPLVVLTGLWIWTDELASWMEDEKAGRRTMVRMFGEQSSARTGVPALVLLFYASLLLAVATASLSPLALVALISYRFVQKIVTLSWKAYNKPASMLVARRYAFALQLVTGIILASIPLLELRSIAI